MRRIVLWLACIGLLVGGAQLAYLRYGGPPDQAGTASFPQGITVANLRTAALPGAAGSSRITGLPELKVGIAQDVDFVADEESLQVLTARERTDQYLDWLLFTAASALQPSLQTYSDALFDLPAIRRGYLRPVGEYEFGRTRSRYLGGGTVLALVPAGLAAAERADLLGQVADEHRKNRTSVFERMAVVEYALKPAAKSATLTRQADIPGVTLFSPEYGYAEQRIESEADLSAFLTRVDDLTWASRTSGGLMLGGRRGLSARLQNVRAEHVATIWQSERQINERLSIWEKQTQEDISLFNAEWRGRTYRGPVERAALEAERNRAWEALEHRLAVSRKELKVPNGSGFSLDPAYDFPSLAKVWSEVAPKLQKLDIGSQPAVTAARQQEVASGFAKGDVVPYLRLIEELKAADAAGANAADALKEIEARNRFQAARYDGTLQGTEVGMVLFYTDLLAKLWVINYVDSAPTAQIPEFVTGSGVRLASMYEQETRELPSARLWFGPSSRGFQASADKSTLFLARTATRIYTAGSNPLNPGVEVQTSASLLAPIEWWNDRYAEVARFEPQYERLNQIMKWSLVIGWLNEAQQGETLDFLGKTSVNRSNVFPAWAQGNTQLRFRDWGVIGFLPAGAHGTTTEALPLLYGKPFFSNGEGARLRGGVSLAERDLFKTRAAIPHALNDTPLLRSNLDYSVSRASERQLTSLDGTEFRFAEGSPGTHTVTARAKQAVKLRGSTAQLAPEDIQRVAYARPGGVSLETKAGSSPIGELSIERSTNGFRVGWNARELDVGQDLARRLSAATDPMSLLLDQQRISQVVRLADPDHYAIRLHGSDRWLRLAPEPAPRADIAPGWQMRVSEANHSRRTIQLSVMDEPQFAASLSERGHLVIDGQHPGLLRIATEDVPSAARRVEIEVAGHRIIGAIDAESGLLHIIKVLPPEKGRSLAGLMDRIGPDELRVIRETTGRSGDGVVVRLSKDRSAQDTAVWMEQGDHHAAAKAIAGDPEAAGKAIDMRMSDELAFNKALIANDLPDKALQQLDALIKTYGERADLLLQRALVQLGRGRIEAAVESASLITRGSGSGRLTFLDELRANIAAARRGPTVGRADLADMQRLQHYVEWQDQLGQAPGSFGGSVQPVMVNERFGIGLHLPAAPDGTPMSASQAALVSGDRAVVYHQPSAGLDSLDWSVPIGKTFEQIVTGRLGRVVKLPRGDIAQYRPELIWLPDAQVPLKAHGQHTWSHLPHPSGANNTPSCPSGSNVRRDCAAAGPTAPAPAEVYLVLAD